MQEREIETTVSDEDTVNEIADSDIDNTESNDIESKEDSLDTVIDESVDTESSDSDNENDVYVVSENVSVSSFDYTGNLETIIEQQSTTNELLVRINEQNDFMIALSVTFMFCVVCYKILHGFSKI